MMWGGSAAAGPGKLDHVTGVVGSLKKDIQYELQRGDHRGVGVSGLDLNFCTKGFNQNQSAGEKLLETLIQGQKGHRGFDTITTLGSNQT